MATIGFLVERSTVPRPFNNADFNVIAWQRQINAWPNHHHFHLAGARFERYQVIISRSNQPVQKNDFYELFLPPWPLLAVSGVAPMTWLWRWRKRRLANHPGIYACEVCGYDLRATPQRCPECGAVVPPSQIASP